MIVSQTSPPSRDWPALARQFAVDYAFTAIINTACAIVVTYLMRLGDSFGESWVFSMCIGTAAMLLIDGGRLLFWGQNKPAKAAFLVLLIFSVPIAYLGGNVLAIEILGLPMQQVFNHQIEHATGLMVFITLVCLFVTWLHWSRAELSALKAQAEADKARTTAVEKQAALAQLQVLRAQIEPHMLFNTLANLQGLIAIDPPRAQHMLDQLIHFLRASLSSSRADNTTLHQEFVLMQAYLELMSVRMGARLTYTLHLPEQMNNLVVPPMLLQPVLENAIKHGLEAKIDGGHIEVRAERQDRALLLSVADTGLGLEATAGAQYQQHGTELGLANIRSRLQALYGERARFTLAPNTPCGAVARFTLPLSP